jgi:serine/threonine-protein kinase
MGSVFQAEDLNTKCLVALKMPIEREFATRSDIMRLCREYKLLSQLHHRHIVPVFRIGVHNGVNFFTMKFIPGGNLGQRFQKYVRRPAAIIPLIHKIALALQHAHARSEPILHRDLKPSNILLSRRGVPYLSDFGLGKSLVEKSELTLSGMLAGTPQYMSPEQAGGEFQRLGPASDVFSLGAILYHLLAGRPPFNSNSTAGVLEQVQKCRFVSLRELNQGVSPELDLIVSRCMARLPEHRYASAGDLAEDLDQVAHLHRAESPQRIHKARCEGHSAITSCSSQSLAEDRQVFA